MDTAICKKCGFRDDFCFVIADSPFKFNGQETLVVKTDRSLINQVIEAARIANVEKIYIANVGEVLTRSVSYKSSKS